MKMKSRVIAPSPQRIKGSDDNNYELWEWIHSLRQILNPDKFVNSPADIDQEHSLFDRDFRYDVYNSTPPENFYKRWRTILKRPGEKLDRDFVREDQPFWVLYSKDAAENSRQEAKTRQKCINQTERMLRRVNRL